MFQEYKGNKLDSTLVCKNSIILSFRYLISHDKAEVSLECAVKKN